MRALAGTYRSLKNNTPFFFIFILVKYLVNMKSLFLAILGGAVLCLTTACGSKNKTTPEATLTVTTSPAIGTTAAPAPGPFNLTVTITSAMPAKGVDIKVTAEPDGSTVAFFSTDLNSTQSVNNFSITGTPVGVVAVVNITVTSLSTPTNIFSGSYRYSAK
jgi:hypothetical protein